MRCGKWRSAIWFRLYVGEKCDYLHAGEHCVDWTSLFADRADVTCISCWDAFRVVLRVLTLVM